MPHDWGSIEFRKKSNDSSGERRIYVCECGNVRIEEKHFRYTFAPEEFIALLRQLSPSKVCQIGNLKSDFQVLVKIAGRTISEKGANRFR